MSVVITLSPKISALIEHANHAFGANATLLIHRSGQILAKHGSMDENDYPTLAVLVAGMVAAGQSLAELANAPDSQEFTLAHGVGEHGLYAAQLDTDHWVFSIHQNMLNPGLFRMQVRRLVNEIQRELATKPILVNSVSESPQESANRGVSPALTGQNAPHLFRDITDEEIDRLFEA